MRVETILTLAVGILVGWLLGYGRANPGISVAARGCSDDRLPMSVIAAVICVIGTLGFGTFEFLTKLAPTLGRAVLEMAPRTIERVATVCLWLGMIATGAAAITLGRRLAQSLALAKKG